MKLLNIEKAPVSSEKKLVATFCQCKGTTKCLPKDRKRIAFGSKNSTTFVSGATETERDNYIKRHQVNEDWSKINAGSLSRYILWSKKTISAGIAEFKKRFSC